MAEIGETAHKMLWLWKLLLKTANIATEAGLSDLVEISIASITNTQIFWTNMHEIQYCDFNKMYFGDYLSWNTFL